MSSANKTANLNMHSWVPTDPVARADFNENFNKIDAAVGQLRANCGNCEIYVGQYTGTGSHVYSLTFPKLPAFIFLSNDTLPTYYSAFVKEGKIFSTGNYYSTISISGKTVSFTNSSTSEPPLNYTGKVNYYVALALANQ